MKNGTIDPGPPGGKNRWLSDALAKLIADFSHGPVKVSDLMVGLHGQAWMVFLALISLPFCTPIPLPGVSTPFGLAIALIGFRLFLGKTPSLPQRVLNAKLPPKFSSTLLGATRKLIGVLELVLRERWCWLIEVKALQQLYGLMMLISGVLLSLPFPIPLTNTFPGSTVLFLACASLGRDGYFVVAAAVTFTLTLAYFGILFFGSAEAFYFLRHRMDGLLGY